MAQATLSCPCGAIHLETPFLGFFRNYLPSRISAYCYFFDSLSLPPQAQGEGGPRGMLRTERRPHPPGKKPPPGMPGGGAFRFGGDQATTKNLIRNSREMT